MKHLASIHINKPPENVFKLVSGLDHFNDWLPSTPGYTGTELTSELPIGKGSTYKVITPKGFRDGVVDTFEPHKRLIYKETLKFPLGAMMYITIEYKLIKEGKGTKLERHLHVQAPFLLRPVLKANESAISAEIEKYMQDLKVEAERT